jgi:hypothetical protein
MATTYEPIATTTLGSNQATVDFTGISQAYTDLILVIDSTSTTSAGIYIQVGDASIDTGTNYSYTYLQGNGTAASSGRAATQASIYCADQSSTSRQTTILQFNNYSNTTTYKTIISRGSSASQSSTAVVGLWRGASTAAIKLIKLLNGNFTTGSTFTLYGIKAA